MKTQNDPNQPVTKREFQEHKKEFQEHTKEFHEFVEFTAKTVATKDDLKQFATKDDLKKFATKEELDSFRKAAFKHFATKEDMRRIVEKSEERIIKNNSQVLASNDKMSKKLDIILDELPAKAAQDREQNDRLDVIETHLDFHPVAA